MKRGSEAAFESRIEILTLEVDGEAGPGRAALIPGLHPGTPSLLLRFGSFYSGGSGRKPSSFACSSSSRKWDVSRMYLCRCSGLNIVEAAPLRLIGTVSGLGAGSRRGHHSAAARRPNLGPERMFGVRPEERSQQSQSVFT